jgi:4-hydroxybenzoate polyprenyltransferase
LNSSKKILFVDLDNTFVSTDILFELILKMIKKSPFNLFYLFVWLFKGKAYLKDKLANNYDIDVDTLPYNVNVLQYLNENKSKWERIVLATGTNELVANKIYKNNSSIFSDVLSSNDKTNLIGKNKLAAINIYLKGKSFDYIGDSISDLKIWRAASNAIVVDPSLIVNLKIRNIKNMMIISTKNKKNRLKSWFRLIRIHQWMKNLLLFLPLIMSHLFFDFKVIFINLIAFFSFSLIASSGYIINDFMDIDSDRKDSHNKHRPIASGTISIRDSFITFIFLVVFGFTLSIFKLPFLFTIFLLSYLFISLVYTFFLKKIVIIDVIILSLLYNIRIISGGIATTIAISPWLLMFSTFFFMNLAFMKRYIWLDKVKSKDMNLSVRGYLKSDKSIIKSAGIASGFISIIIFLSYIHSDHIKSLYSQPYVLWLIIPLLFYFITRLWVITNRGIMHKDPVIFILKDYPSYTLLFIIIIIFIIAKFYHSQFLMNYLI